MSISRFAVLPVLLLTLGCQLQSDVVASDATSDKKTSTISPVAVGAPLKVIEVDQSSGVVVVEAISHGCTRPDSIEVSVDKAGVYSAKRVKIDRCRKRAATVQFDIPLKDVVSLAQ